MTDSHAPDQGKPEITHPEAWLAFTTGVPREELRPEIRDAAEAAVAAGVARWAIVGGETRLRWNYPEPTSAWYVGTDDEFAHYARNAHTRAVCGWDMLYSPGLPLKVGDTQPHCPRCEAKLLPSPRWS
jgi:hypothetical protein